MMTAVAGSLPFLTRLANDRHGAAAPMAALGMVVVLGFVGMGVDIGHNYVQRRTAQHAADSAAFSGAVALDRGVGDPAAEARAVAVQYGFDPAAVAVNLPPLTGPNASRAGHVEVLIERPGHRFFSALLDVAAPKIRARAVGRIGQPGDACVVALNGSARATASFAGATDIVLNGCSLFANSSSDSALELSGNSRLTAKSVGVVGGYAQSSNSNISTQQGIHTGQAPIEDPYKDVEIPEYKNRPCDFSSKQVPTGLYGRSDGQPFVFCGGLQINSRDTVTLRPGTYVIDGGDLLVNGGATLTSNGPVTIILTSRTGLDHGSIDIRGGAEVKLTAPTSGDLSGLVFFQDRNAPHGESKLNGGSTQSIEGTIYAPSRKLVFTGGSETTGGCTQILASEVEFSGNARLELDCTSKGVRMAGGRRTALVE